MNRLCFTTSKFGVEPGEEERTNPGRYGKQLAEWIKEKLILKDHHIEQDIIPEDWGWLVMVQRKPFPLWVGCGNKDGSTEQWMVFVETEPNYLQKLLKKADPDSLLIQLQEEVEQIVNEDPAISNAAWEES